KARALVVADAKLAIRRGNRSECCRREAPGAVGEVLLAGAAKAPALLDGVAAASYQGVAHQRLSGDAEAVDERITQLPERHGSSDRSHRLRERGVVGPILDAPCEFLAAIAFARRTAQLHVDAISERKEV